MIFHLAHRFKPERVTYPKDSENAEVNDRLEGHFGALVSDVKLCHLKENVFVAEKSQRQKTKWKAKFLDDICCIGRISL